MSTSSSRITFSSSELELVTEALEVFRFLQLEGFTEAHHVRLALAAETLEKRIRKSMKTEGKHRFLRAS